jgi:hypothetical protein
MAIIRAAMVKREKGGTESQLSNHLLSVLHEASPVAAVEEGCDK